MLVVGNLHQPGHQAAAVYRLRKILKRWNGAWNGDDMDFGKTIVSIAK